MKPTFALTIAVLTFTSCKERFDGSAVALSEAASGGASPEELLKKVFQTGGVTDPDDEHAVTMAPILVAAIESLANHGHVLRVHPEGGPSSIITLDDLRTQNFDVEGVMHLLEVSEFFRFKASIRMHRPVPGTSEATNVYVFIYGHYENDSGKVFINKFEVDYRGIS